MVFFEALRLTPSPYHVLLWYLSILHLLIDENGRGSCVKFSEVYDVSLFFLLTLLQPQFVSPGNPRALPFSCVLAGKTRVAGSGVPFINMTILLNISGQH